MPESPWLGNSPIEPVHAWTLGGDVDSDSVDSGPFKGFHVNVAGTIKFNDYAGNTMTHVVNAGTYYPYIVTRLWTTGHTTLAATDIRLAR